LCPRILLAATLAAWCHGCSEDSAAPAHERDEPDEVVRPVIDTYALSVRASGLGGQTVRLSLDGQRAVDITGDGTQVVLEKLPAGRAYAVWIDKTPQWLDCALSAEPGARGVQRAEGRIAAADVTLSLHCLSSDTRLSELTLATLDARLEPEFTPDGLDYTLDAYHVNTRAWLTAVPVEDAARLRVRLDGEELPQASETLELALDGGAQQLELELTAPSGHTRSYVVALARRPARVERASLAMDGAEIATGLQAAAVSEKYLALGANRANQSAGEVQLFRRTPEGWVPDGKLTHRFEGAERAAIGGFFGYAVALSGEWLAVGAPMLTEAPPEDLAPSRGKVIVFQRTSEGWQERARLAPPEPKPHDFYGASLAMRGDVLAVGNPPAVFEVGSVDLYGLEQSQWTHRQTLVGEGDLIDFADRFGETVALGDGLLSVSAPSERLGVPPDFEFGDEEPATDVSGAVYVYDLSSGAAVLDTRLENPGQSSVFGYALALRDGILAASAPYTFAEEVDPVDEQGVVYLFRRGTEGWRSLRTIVAPAMPIRQDTDVPANFGSGLAFTEDALWVGASDADLGAEHPADGGAVYRFALGAGELDATPAPVPLAPSQVAAGLGTRLTSSPDGIVCVSEPRAKPEVGKLTGRVILLQ
jgi:hypothetical protein